MVFLAMAHLHSLETSRNTFTVFAASISTTEFFVTLILITQKFHRRLFHGKYLKFLEWLFLESYFCKKYCHLLSEF